MSAKKQNHYTPLRQSMYESFNLCRYVVPCTVFSDVEAHKFFAMKRQASRNAYYIQAISRVLKQHPRVNSSFVRNFWTNTSRLVQWDTVDAAVSIDRKFDGERYPLAWVLRNSDKLTVKEIDEQIRYAAETPVEKIPEFASYLKFVSLPKLVRKLYLRKMICDEALMRSKIGTFNFTNLSYWGFRGGSMPTPRLLVGLTTPYGDEPKLAIGYSFNHVITDGAQIGEFHRDIQRFFRKCEFE